MSVRTSATDPIRVDWLPGRRVGLTFAPGKRATSLRTGSLWLRDLGTDLQALRTQGVDVLVCLLERHELVAMGITQLVTVAERAGIVVVRSPIPDGSVPRSRRRLAGLLGCVRADVDVGLRVAIHCAGGLGRTGVVAGCHLVQTGMGADEALQTLRRTRGPSCPETPEQMEYVRQWAATRRRAA